MENQFKTPVFDGKVEAMMPRYTESTDTLQQLFVKRGMELLAWNRALPYPLVDGEQVWVHPSQFGITDSYVRIVHSSEKVISVFNRSYFYTSDESDIKEKTTLDMSGDDVLKTNEDETISE